MLVMDDEELQVELARINRRVLQIILTFVKKNYPNDKKFLATISRVSREINVGIDATSKINGIAYFSNLGQIRVVPKFFEVDEVEKIDILLHEYAHAINNYNMRSKLDFLEEGFADLFAEILVNDWIFNQDGLKKIPKVIRDNYVEGLDNYAHGYPEERQIAKDIMILFSRYHESYEETLVNFLNGNDNFYKSAERLNGDSASKLFQFFRDSIITTRYTNAGEFYDTARAYAVRILEKTLTPYSSKEIGKKGEQLPNTIESICFKNNIGVNIIKNAKQIEEMLGESFDYDNPTKESIDEIRAKCSGLLYAVCNHGYVPKKLDRFVKNWFKKCNGNLKEFDYILGTIPCIPDSLFSDILRTTPSADSKFILRCIRNYAVSKIEDSLYVNRILANEGPSCEKTEVMIFMLKELTINERIEALANIMNDIDLNADYVSIYELSEYIKNTVHLPELPINIEHLTNSLNKVRRFTPNKNRDGKIVAGNVIRGSFIGVEKALNAKIYSDYCDVYMALSRFNIIANHNVIMTRLKTGTIAAPTLKLDLVKDEDKPEVLVAVAGVLKKYHLRFFIDDLKQYLKVLYNDIKDPDIRAKFERIMHYDDYLNMMINNEDVQDIVR